MTLWHLTCPVERCTPRSTFPDPYMLHIHVLNRSCSSSGSKHLSCVTRLEFWPSASLWITEPQLVYLLPCWHPRWAFPGTDMWTAHVGQWVVLYSSELYGLRNAVKFTVMPLAVMSAISEVNLCPADAAVRWDGQINWQHRGIPALFNMFVDSLKCSQLENSTTEEVRICANNTHPRSCIYDLCFLNPECVCVFSTKCV